MKRVASDLGEGAMVVAFVHDTCTTPDRAITTVPGWAMMPISPLTPLLTRDLFGR